jgi:hypothetical protein
MCSDDIYCPCDSPLPRNNQKRREVAMFEMAGSPVEGALVGWPGCGKCGIGFGAGAGVGSDEGSISCLMKYSSV